MHTAYDTCLHFYSAKKSGRFFVVDSRRRIFYVEPTLLGALKELIFFWRFANEGKNLATMGIDLKHHFQQQL